MDIIDHHHHHRNMQNQLSAPLDQRLDVRTVCISYTYRSHIQSGEHLVTTRDGNSADWNKCPICWTGFAPVEVH